MRLASHRVIRSLIAALFIVSAVSLSSPFMVIPAAAASAEELAAVALAVLRAEYQILISGSAVAPPLPALVDGLGRVRESGDRVQQVLERRQVNANYGVFFTDVQVSVTPLTTIIQGDELRLRARESFSLGSRSVHHPDPARVERTLGSNGHTFVFSKTKYGWKLIRDELDRLETHSATDPIPFPDRTASLQRSTPRSGRGAHLAAPMRAGFYNRSAVQVYAAQYGVNYNPNYRIFADVGGDCTNFVSQAVKAGGWVDRYGPYTDWNYWWYGDVNQTRTWTYTHAFQYFFGNSGRGQFYSYLGDLWIADIIQIDFGPTPSGSIDHSMIIDDITGSDLGSFFVSYHSTSVDTNRYHERLSDVIARNPGSNWWAMHVTGTEP